jgi:hypothetical protein
MVVHDQFYTKPEVATRCYDTLKQKVNVDTYDIILEPSAGKGSFYDLLPDTKRIGIDIDPKKNGIITMDFFEYEADISKNYLVIGNPPFGKVCSLAIKFFNKSAEFADTIAFIVPRTFKRVSVQNQLDMKFHLIYTEDVPLTPCCFEPTMSAKCCFQIWVKNKNTRRTKVVYSKSHPHFEFVKYGPNDEKGQPTPPSNSDFAVKAYGGKCGVICTQDLNTLRPKSWHWLKSRIDQDTLINRIKNLDFSMSEDTVRQNSIGQQEFIHLYESKYGR